MLRPWRNERNPAGWFAGWLVRQRLGHALELGRRDGLGRGRRAGIVDEEIQAAQGVDAARDHGFGLTGDGNAAGDADHVEPLSLELIEAGRRRWVAWQVVHRHPGAGAGQQGDAGEADAGGTAGDEACAAGALRHGS